MTLPSSIGHAGCQKCENEKVKVIRDNIDNLTTQMVKDFLCTFDNSCSTNIEFTQWSNEMLFKVLDKEPRLIINALDQNHFGNIEILLEEIENPIYDYDYQEIYDKLSRVQTKKGNKERLLKSIELAAIKDGIKIKR